MITFIRVSFFALLLALFSVCSLPAHAGDAPRLSFATFDQRARDGDALNVVFFGGSLTWGSNASDPNITSYRGLTGERLRQTYPRARFKFIDAALGGTGSQTGVFRLERDVLRHKPDLVFLDFSLNDNLDSPDESRLAAYESLLRRIMLEGKCPVEVVIFPGKKHVLRPTPDHVPGRVKHRQIAQAYGVPIGDALAHIHQLVQDKSVDPEKLWPYDPIHPCDDGYALYAQAAWAAFESAVRAGTECRVPEKMIRGDDYMTWSRARLSSLGQLPEGWSVTKPNVSAAYFDGLMSRWLYDETRAFNGIEPPPPYTDGPMGGKLVKVAPLQVKFRGTMVLLLGERTLMSGKVRVLLNGKPMQFGWPPAKEYDASSRQWHGNQFLSEVVAANLPPNVEHTLRIEPVFLENEPQEFRIESICVAGPGASVRLDK